MNFAVLEMRHAFERDMVRRLGSKAFEQQPISEVVCAWCNEIFTRNIGAYRNTGLRPANAITCSPECGRLNKNRKQREWHHIHGATRNAKRRRERANNSRN